MTAAQDYRLERLAQDERFNSRPGAGSVDSTCTESEEYQAYFGLGDFRGQGVEERVTFRQHLVNGGRESAAERLAAPITDAPAVGFAPDATPAGFAPQWTFYLTGAELAGLAEAGDVAAVDEIRRRAVNRAARRALRGSR